MAHIRLLPEDSAHPKFEKSDFVRECLEWHNVYRKRHSAPAMELDEGVRNLRKRETRVKKY